MPNAINKCNRNPHENEENNEKNTWKPKSTWKRAWKNKPISKLKKWKTKHANNMKKRKNIGGKAGIAQNLEKAHFLDRVSVFHVFFIFGILLGFCRKNTHKENMKNEKQWKKWTNRTISPRKLCFHMLDKSCFPTNIFSFVFHVFFSLFFSFVYLDFGFHFFSSFFIWSSVFIF